MGTAFYIAQAVSLAAMAASITIQQLKDIRQIIAGSFVINLLSAIQYLLLGGLSGGWICIVAAFQCVAMFFVSRREDANKLRKWFLLLFAAMYVAGTCMVYQGIKDLFSCAGALFFVLSILQEKPAKYRRFSACNALVWIVYNIPTGAYVNLVSQLFKLGSILVAMVRMDLPKNKLKEKAI